MAGITSYGAYIPLQRISRKTISAATGWSTSAASAPGEKAVANYDEDSLTMAVAAATDCLNGLERDKVDGIYLATTTPPYRERQNAGIIATALDLQPAIRTCDFSDSIKAGTGALLSACDAIEAGTGENIMVCASDCRPGKAGSFQEVMFGEGAAALMIGNKDVIADLKGSYSLSYDFMDQWRADGDKYNRIWEDRWIRDEAYTKFIPEAIAGLLKKYSLETKDFAKIIFPCVYLREHGAIAKRLQLEPEQVQQEILTTIGDTGTAHSLMMLVAALEEAKPGDRILVASYGNGSDAMFFEVTDKIKKIKGRRGIKKHLESRKELTSYERYSSFRDVIPLEMGFRGEVGPSMVSVMWRERKTILGLVGTKCKRCGTPQYPYQRVCVNPACGAIDEMEEYRFSDKKGRLFSYTSDSLAFSASPPEMYGIISFEEGGRFAFNLTDCDMESLSVDMPVEMSFRKKYADQVRGIHGYFWKAMPPRA
ncbi:MAG TPA: hydroxymethylglutaryl-CoA synthase family protein [Dehalococcoidia bacterium]|nr:hydroxymethylglutaryl-CoA synthase family protein [Dehalococcoidia bacterium]